METRIISKGKIDTLTGRGFTLGGVPFSIYVRHKSGLVENDTVVNCRLIGDNHYGDFPVPVGDWTPGMIVAIAPDAINLTHYDVYWGASETTKPIP